MGGGISLWAYPNVSFTGEQIMNIDIWIDA
jgi:hypothetical protein